MGNALGIGKDPALTIIAYAVVSVSGTYNSYSLNTTTGYASASITVTGNIPFITTRTCTIVVRCQASNGIWSDDVNSPFPFKTMPINLNHKFSGSISGGGGEGPPL